MKHTPMVLHRELLREALGLAWKRKALWVFGLFAALVSTGGIVDMAFRTFRQVEAGRDLYFQALDNALPFASWFSTYFRLLDVVDHSRVTLTIIVATLLLIALAFFAVLSQGALMVGSMAKNHEHPSTLMRKALPWVPTLAVIAFIGKLAQAILVALTTLPLVLYLTNASLENGLIYFVLFLMFFPATVLVQLVSILAGFEIVRHETSLVQGFKGALAMAYRHWLAALELGVLLFLITGLMGMAAGVLFILLAIPFTILISASIAAGTPVLFIGSVSVAAITAAVLSWMTVGASITIQYTAWSLFHDRASHPHPKTRMIPKLERLWAKL